MAGERTRTLEDHVFSHLVIEAPHFLAFFQTHALGNNAMNEASIRHQRKLISERANEYLANGDSVVFVFEDGSAVSKNHHNTYSEWLRNPDQPDPFLGLTLPEFSVRMVKESMESGDSELAYAALQYVFFGATRSSAKLPSAVTGLVEHCPIQYNPVIRFAREIKDPSTSPKKVFNRTIQLVTYIMTRDLRLAGQISQERRANPKAFFIVERGSMHVGLIRALQIVESGFPDIHQKENLLMDAWPGHAMILPILWNRKIWQTAFDDSGVTPVSVLEDAGVSKFGKTLRKILTTGNVSAWLTNQVASVHGRRAQGVKAGVLLQQVDLL